jgi:hypothetical protein
MHKNLQKMAVILHKRVPNIGLKSVNTILRADSTQPTMFLFWQSGSEKPKTRKRFAVMGEI